MYTYVRVCVYIYIYTHMCKHSFTDRTCRDAPVAKQIVKQRAGRMNIFSRENGSGGPPAKRQSCWKPRSALK